MFATELSLMGLREGEKVTRCDLIEFMGPRILDRTAEIARLPSGGRLFRQGLGDLPSLVKTPSHCRVGETESSTPFGNRQALAVELNNSARPTVLCLFVSGCPTAVARLIVAVVVDAFNGVLGRRHVAHVGEKVLKGCCPAGANLDPPATVDFEMRASRIRASLNNALPAAEFGGLALSMRGDSIPVKASARFSTPGFEVVAGNNLDVSALAAAIPSRLAGGGVCRAGDDRQSPERLPGDVDGFDVFLSVQTAAGLGVSIAKVFAVNDGFLAAIAAAPPAASSIVVVLAARQDGETAEGATGQVDWRGHRITPMQTQ